MKLPTIVLLVAVMTAALMAFGIIETVLWRVLLSLLMATVTWPLLEIAEALEQKEGRE
ncbi:MAG: hypothetical protein ACN2B6_01025 [Rickettsiales bacterium]